MQHAHERGIIHRDLKPSNVLVTLGDQPQPKVIDFGLAKATGRSLANDITLTKVGARLGTPAYASPEQMHLDGIDVDTRTDVYSLGVMLYELLVGALPFDTTADPRLALGELRQRIWDNEPTPPTKRLASLPERAEVARARGTDTAALDRQLRGDLEWIVLKAIDRVRDRRYGSVEDLAADLTSRTSRCSPAHRRRRTGWASSYAATASEWRPARWWSGYWSASPRCWPCKRSASRASAIGPRRRPPRARRLRSSSSTP